MGALQVQKMGCSALYGTLPMEKGAVLKCPGGPMVGKSTLKCPLD